MGKDEFITLESRTAQIKQNTKKEHRNRTERPDQTFQNPPKWK